MPFRAFLLSKSQPRINATFSRARIDCIYPRWTVIVFTAKRIGFSGNFRGRVGPALQALEAFPPDVFNHNLETVPSLYKKVRPGSDYEWSLDLLLAFKKAHPTIPTKSGLMLGVGETFEEVVAVLEDLREHEVDMATLGQYLQPSRDHLAVDRFVTPEEFASYEKAAYGKGFLMVSATPLTRSSYHAGDDFAQLRENRLAKLARA